MSIKSEHNIQNAIRLDLSQTGVVLRLNSGRFWQGKRVYSHEYGQYVLVDIRPVVGCPEGTSDLVYFGENGVAAFIECKSATGSAKEAQRRFLDMMNSYGFPSGIARSPEEARQIITSGGKNNGRNQTI